MPLLPRADAAHAIPLHLVTAPEWEAGLDGGRLGLPAGALAFARAGGFAGKAGQVALLPDEEGRIVAILAGQNGESGDGFAPAKLVSQLPAGSYALPASMAEPELAALGWLLSSYRFTRYRAEGTPLPQLVVPEGVDAAPLERIAAAVAMGRNLINTPTNDMGPVALTAAAVALAERHGASVEVIEGDALLSRNFPLIHMVGRAAAEAPRLVDIRWREADADFPRLTLVGKGVCFDTGGLDIKPSASMLMMKKDMGGAAAALAAADMIMGDHLPVRLRVLLPIVENAISASAFRPGDISASRKGTTVEIGNTDAEGRLILADALTYADEEETDLIIDFATLTGAARVALGPDLPPFFTDDEALAGAIEQAGRAVNDPVWRLPLWPGYRSMLESKVADTNNVSSGGFAGAITAALFLRRFLRAETRHAHFDIYGWTPKTRPGRPEGGEPQAARLVHALARQRYQP
jgi:leucyl aminopeptidase